MESIKDEKFAEKLEKLENKAVNAKEKIEEIKNAKAEKSEKISRFAAILSELRKERGISQKKAASHLGISQALLSHYEKGIRECGLDFLIKCSEYYGVTTDYLLGISKSRNGIDAMSLLNTDESCESEISTLAGATEFLLNIISTARDETATKYIYDYYMLCVYRGALTMAKAGLLPKEMFKLDFNLGRELATASIAVEDARFGFIEDKSRNGSDLGAKSALHNLIENAEEHILANFLL
ncbi:MAG: helix-turn-helix domain-containing protein [Acetobacter sp.]|nr:helix-turn-helix domain-containing protein [Bacteroides sp.]MCM1340382.1 helix-turn-helix domain-containing protein [Acetobacter sp.]MCM1432971.1 helix-turn-helix domain-containing protein [Clostridiales bacterium]